MKLDDPANLNTKNLIIKVVVLIIVLKNSNLIEIICNFVFKLKAIKNLEAALLQRTFLSEKSQNEKEETIIKPIDPKIYCKLGHFNLLLGNYAKGTLHCLD